MLYLCGSHRCKYCPKYLWLNKKKRYVKRKFYEDLYLTWTFVSHIDLEKNCFCFIIHRISFFLFFSKIESKNKNIQMVLALLKGAIDYKWKGEELTESLRYWITFESYTVCQWHSSNIFQEEMFHETERETTILWWKRQI